MQQFIATKQNFEELCLAKGKALIIVRKFPTELQVRQALLEEKEARKKEHCQVTVNLSPRHEEKVVKGKRKRKLLGVWVEVEE